MAPHGLARKTAFYTDTMRLHSGPFITCLFSPSLAVTLLLSAAHWSRGGEGRKQERAPVQKQMCNHTPHNLITVS